MFQYVYHKDINFSKWDKCIDSSVNGIIYGLSWYLNIVSPGWDAIINEKNEKYIAVFPVTKAFKFGIPFLKQPIYAHQLGLFQINDEVSDNEWEIIFDTLLSKFQLITHYELNFYNTYVLNNNISKVSVKKFSTYHINLALSYKEIAGNYKKDRKWRINKARRDNLKVIRQSNNIDALVDIFRSQTENRIYGIIGESYEYRIIKELFLASKERKLGELLEVRDSMNTLLGSCFLLIYKGKIIYVFNSSTKEGKRKNCMSFLIDEIFRSYAGSNFIFDFESPEVLEVAEFYKRFGSVEVNFPSISYNRMPLYQQVLKGMRKNFFEFKKMIVDH